MGRQTRQAAFAAVGAVIGAGFASGQEIGAFFSRYGRWSWVGIAAAVGMAWWIARGSMRASRPGGMPEGWQGRWPGRLWQGVFLLLMLTTGGAMLAGGGEVFALMLPVKGARLPGMGATGYLAWRLARKGSGGAGISRVLTLMLLVMAAGGLLLPERPGAVVTEKRPWMSLASGGCYAGFNMALAAPGLAASSPGMSVRERRACAAVAAGILGLLMALGNGLLLRHSALIGESMPFVRMTSAWGKAGYLFACACMYLAVVTTAGAAAGGVKALLPERCGVRRFAWIAMLLCAAAGFEEVVNRVYPLLGAGCLALMLGAYTGKNEKNA